MIVSSKPAVLRPLYRDGTYAVSRHSDDKGWRVFGRNCAADVAADVQFDEVVAVALAHPDSWWTPWSPGERGKTIVIVPIEK